MVQNKIFRGRFYILPKSCPRPRLSRGRAYMPKHYREWTKEFNKKLVQHWDRKMKRDKNPYTTDFYIFIKVYHSHHNTGDVDNISKSILDALQEDIIEDDELCKGLFITQFEQCENNRIDLRIVTVDRWTNLSRQTHLNWFDWLDLEPSQTN